MNESLKPTDNDAVLGGNDPTPAQAAVLGGLPNAESRLKSTSLDTRLEALRDCTKYGHRGLSYVIEALNDPLPRTQYEAYLLLHKREEMEVKEALRRYKFWRHFERLYEHSDRYPLPNRYPERASTFVNRQVKDFSPETRIEEPISTAYTLRLEQYGESVEEKLHNLILDTQSQKVEALIFGYWGGGSSNEVVDCLIDVSENLPNLTALFLGDIKDEEDMISSINHARC